MRRTTERQRAAESEELFTEVPASFISVIYEWNILDEKRENEAMGSKNAFKKIMRNAFKKIIRHLIKA